MGLFYNHVLSKVQPYSEILEKDADIIASYLPPEAKFVFYLDYINNKNITCNIEIYYGDKSFDPYERSTETDGIRDFPKEIEVMLKVKGYLPYYDEIKKVCHCKGEETLIYTMLEDGMNELLTLGEVRISDSLKRLQIKPSPKVSIGVSVDSDLLNLSFSTENFDFSDLSDILELINCVKNSIA